MKSLVATIGLIYRINTQSINNLCYYTPLLYRDGQSFGLDLIS